MRAHEFISEDITQQDLDKVETFADKLWARYGIDINFTRHFFDRVNDPRNGKPISAAELVRLFRREYERWGKTIAGTDGEAVMKDAGTDVNLPFAKHGNRLAAKTIMRKDNFKTPDPEYVVEKELPKNRWETVMSTDEKREMGDDLVNLVQTAYGNTDKGSFVNSIRDVLPSDWKVLDWDHKPDVDCAIFYRGPRGNENWAGNKIQGLGHDGERGSKDHVIQQMVALLGKAGWWIECNGAMRAILKKAGLPMLDDEATLQTLFNDPELRMVSADSYVRFLDDGSEIEESVAGSPRVRGQLSEKIKGVDGKACWDGYRYAGTENGKDKCVKAKK